MGDGAKDEGRPGEGGGNINQIRDILIGPFQRDQEARFARAEQSLERIAREAAEQTEHASAQLRKALEAAVDAIEARLTDLTKRLAESDSSAKRELTRVSDDLGAHLRDVDRRLRTEIEENERSADRRLRSLREEIEAALAKLRDEKTGREDLGDYLMEIGLRLKGEPSLNALETSLEDALRGESGDPQS
jgi:hypothetical protein